MNGMLLCHALKDYPTMHMVKYSNVTIRNRFRGKL